MATKTDGSVSASVAIIGSSVAAIQAALTLAQMGVQVKLLTGSVALGDGVINSPSVNNYSLDQRYLWPLSLQASSHPLITLHTSAEVGSIQGTKGDFKIQVVQHPRYIHEDLCTGCGRCQVECSAKVISLVRGQKITHAAIHTPLLGGKSVPSAYVIDKNGFAPCHVACPLGINVQGFISLLANDKTDRALALINEAAPLSGILGRVCTHPCEDNCNRDRFDSSVSIKALHRYAADNASRGIKYSRRYPAGSQKEKIAIVGSGPAGLTAAWELTRLGYSPTVFESHGVIGGMLATGIPRFRLPREVRERELESLKELGIDIRTGITVGRDVTFSYLKERGYLAFFLSIGAQLNNKLDIPGEELDGVMDCMSLLLTLNLKVVTFAGQNVVVIGGGNAAIDAARSAVRSGARGVTILYRRTQAEMPANIEEVKEGIKEGVKIEYNTVPVEIMGDAERVNRIRCQQTRPTEEIMEGSAYRLEPVPGTEFLIEADHVVVAVGQIPNAAQLKIENLAISPGTGTIQINPLTFETNIPGVFAGGDCITGPNNVVEAMAAGLKASDSINRYLQGQDLIAGRGLEPPKIAEIDIGTVEVLPYERARMPVIWLKNRISSFEETTTGLSSRAAQREAQRCLNCALCSQCMECTKVCEMNAVFHDDSVKHFEIGAKFILRFPSVDLKSDASAANHGKEDTVDGIHVVSPNGNGDLTRQVVKGMAVAFKTAIEIKPNEVEGIQEQGLLEPGIVFKHAHPIPEETEDKCQRIGVFLCRCGGSISSVIDFRTVARKLSGLPGVIHIREIAQACTEAGAREIESQLAEWQLNRVVIAACRCCNLDQVCYSCTDRRMMCQKYLNQYLILPHNTIIEFVNIREQCAWVHKDDPQGATHKAVNIISSGVSRIRLTTIATYQNKSILHSVIIIGREPTGIIAAKALASQGYRVNYVSRGVVKQGNHEHSEAIPPTPGHLNEGEVTIVPWPEVMELHGTPGNYEAVLKYGSLFKRVPAGAVLVDIQELTKDPSPLVTTAYSGGLIGRILSRRNNSDDITDIANDFLREVTIKESSGIFVLAHDGDKSLQEQGLHELASAARVSTFLEKAGISSRATAVNIDSKLCRGCGDCTDVCPYIEMKGREDGTAYASVDKALCIGCGACITRCPTGAITQPIQSDKQIISTVHSMLRISKKLVEV